MENITVLGIDIAKQAFHMAAMNAQGRIILRKKLRRDKLADFVARFPRTVIAMEACSTAHHWAHTFRQLGHEVRLVVPRFVLAYVKSNKNDAADAEAICEAATRGNMRFVSVKSLEKQDWQAVHRIRERVIKFRTALVNQLRGILAERGVILPQGISAVRQQLAETLEMNATSLTSATRRLVLELYEEFLELDRRVNRYERELEEIAKAHPACRRLQTIPGIGPITAVALISCVGNFSEFKNGRHFAASLGVVPRQHSTGGKSRLLGISKRGDVYLRKLLIHGARAVMRYRVGKTDKRSLWLEALVNRRGFHRATVALANKNARTAWALIAKNSDYELQQAA